MTDAPLRPLPDLCDDFPDEVRVLDPVFSNYGGRRAFAGPASTVRCFEDNSLVADAVAEPGEGRVLVVDGGGSMRCGILGDNLALKASQNGWAGLVIAGCIRDVDEIAATDIGVQALGVHPRKSIKRGIGQRDEVVRLAGTTVAPGEWVYADNNGVLVAPRQLT